MVLPRCWSFDPHSGEPLSPAGCPHGNNCSFAHPDSPRWRDAPISKRFSRGRFPSDSSPRDLAYDPAMKPTRKDRLRQRDTSAHGRMASSPDSSTVRRSESRSNDSWKLSWGNSGGESSIRGNPIPPTSESGELPAAATGWGIPSSSTTTWGQDTTSLTRSRQPPSPSSSKEPTQRYPPPPPPSLPPLPPPPPPADSTSVRRPSLHSSNTVGSPTAPKTLEKAKALPATVSMSPDMRKEYMNRVTQLSELVLLNNEYIQATREWEARRQMVNSQKYSHISETSQAKLDKYAQEYEDKARELKSSINDSISKFVESELWPMGVAANEPPAEAAPQQLDDLQTRVKSLEGVINDAKDVSKKPPPLNEEEPSPVGSKRHRQSGPVDSGALSRIERLEARFEDFGNEAMQQTDNLLQKVESRIEEKLEDLRVSKSVPGDIEMSDGGGAVLRGQIDKLSTNMDEYVEETLDLINRQKDMALEMREISKVVSDLRSKNNELESTVDALKRENARTDSQLQALTSAIKIMKATSPPPPAPNNLEQMRREIQQEIIGDLTPALLELRRQCQAIVTEEREETMKYIATKFGRTVEMVNVIYEECLPTPLK